MEISKKVLFICNQNQNRSPTAELLFKDMFETKSGGLFCEDSKKLVNKRLLNWADTVFVMGEFQKEEICRRFSKKYTSKITSLDIPDIYCFNQPELVRLLKGKIESWIDRGFV